jgi:uncharacterized protein with HEPN domain
MNNHTRKLLFDVLESAQSICGWCKPRSFVEYGEDRQLRRAVEREFEIIGEALSRLRQYDEETAARIRQRHRQSEVFEWFAILRSMRGIVSPPGHSKL